VQAWEGSNTRNAGTIPTFSSGISVSSKYAAWSELPVYDVFVRYAALSTPRFFYCEGLDEHDTLDVTFSDVPAQDSCTATCTTWSQDRYAAEIPTGFGGLNCSDGGQDWYTVEPDAENARVGARDSGNRMAGFLGTMGDRSFDSATYEKTWGNNQIGFTTDAGVQFFVR
jgi:hypothetical protein